MAIDAGRAAAALRALADAIEGTPETIVTPAVAPTPRGRGRAKAEGVAVAAPAVAVAPPPTPVVVEADPFSPGIAPATPVAPTATLDEVRKALTELREKTNQGDALAVLEKASGVNNLTALKPELYGAVVAAAKAAVPVAVAAPAVEDPFATPGAEEKLTIEQVKAVIVETQKRTASATVQKLVMDHGGKKADAGVPGGYGPSLQALPVEKYATVVAALKALPSTK